MRSSSTRMRAMISWCAMLLMMCSAPLSAATSTAPATAPAEFLRGGDVSMLYEIEKAGGVYRDKSGKPADAITVLRDHGVNLFRLRLFVNPTTDFNKSWGATQDLTQVTALAKRVKASGAKFLLDLHYSDTWADPAKQFKPAAWKDLPFDALEKQVHDYTASVLKHLIDNGARPDMVQVGNEVAGGMMWPDGKVADVKKEDEARQWERFVKLFNAGGRAVRAASTREHPIGVMIHIHGGGRAGLPTWFFEKFTAAGAEFDLIALSSYPAWDDSIDNLKKNMAELAERYRKPIIVAETSYPWRPMEGFEKKAAMPWPQSREGQVQCIKDHAAALRQVPHGLGLGFIWWYPEAIPVKDLRIWRNGAEALFNDRGEPLPALEAFKDL